MGHLIQLFIRNFRLRPTDGQIISQRKSHRSTHHQPTVPSNTSRSPMDGKTVITLRSEAILCPLHSSSLSEAISKPPEARRGSVRQKGSKMPFRKSRSEEAVDDFDDYDPTPYSGGYDQVLTYGRPLSPSDETCYTTSTAGDIDYERPQYSSGSQISAYGSEGADFGDRYGRSRPKPKIDSTSGYGGDGGALGEYGSGYGGRPQRQEYGSDYGSGYGGGRPKRDEEGEGYGGRSQQESGYGYQEAANRYGEEGYGGTGYRKPSYGEEGYVKHGYGGGEYRRTDVEGKQGYAGGQYGRNQDEGFGGQGYGGGEYRRSEVEGYGGHGGYNEQSGDGGRTGYGRDKEESGRYKKSSYGDEEESSGYRKPSPYGGEEYEGYGRSNYGTAAYDEGKHKHGHQKKHHHHHNHDED